MESDSFCIINLQDDGATMMELWIPHMSSQMYRRHFFVAENDKGKSEYIIELKRGKPWSLHV